MEIFTAELAGVPVQIRCRYPENRRFLREYLTEKSPSAVIEPSEADLSKMREILRSENLSVDSPVYVENNAIHGLLAETLCDYGAVLIHASAVALDGEAFIFMAPSGTGKSTHTRLWLDFFGGRAFMLNDDKPLLKVTPEGVYAFGTPWNGKHHLSRNTAVPVRAIAEVHRDTRNFVESCADPFPALFRFVYRSRNPDTMEKILRLEDEIIRRIPFFHLHCNMNPEAAEISYKGLVSRSGSAAIV